MEKRVSVITIVIEAAQADSSVVEKINQLLHESGIFVVGRMGLPYREMGVNIINIIVDAPQNVTSTLSGKIGKLTGISVKATYTNVISEMK